MVRGKNLVCVMDSGASTILCLFLQLWGEWLSDEVAMQSDTFHRASIEIGKVVEDMPNFLSSLRK